MAYYIAWLNGASVARGTLEAVTSKAEAIFATALWQTTVTERGKATTLRITKGARQTLVSSEELTLKERASC